MLPHDRNIGLYNGEAKLHLGSEKAIRVYF